MNPNINYTFKVELRRSRCGFNEAFIEMREVQQDDQTLFPEDLMFG